MIYNYYSVGEQTILEFTYLLVDLGIKENGKMENVMEKEN